MICQFNTSIASKRKSPFVFVTLPEYELGLLEQLFCQIASLSIAKIYEASWCRRTLKGFCKLLCNSFNIFRGRRSIFQSDDGVVDIVASSDKYKSKFERIVRIQEINRKTLQNGAQLGQSITVIRAILELNILLATICIENVNILRPFWANFNNVFSLVKEVGQL